MPPIFTTACWHGLTPRKTVLIVYAACGIAASLSLLGSVAQDQYRGLIIIVFCAAAWIGVQHLGYAEFGMAGRMFVSRAFRKHLNNHLAVRSFEEALVAAMTTEDRWTIICEACRTFGFTHAELELNGRRLKKIFGGYQRQSRVDTQDPSRRRWPSAPDALLW